VGRSADSGMYSPESLQAVGMTPSMKSMPRSPSVDRAEKAYKFKYDSPSQLGGAMKREGYSAPSPSFKRDHFKQYWGSMLERRGPKGFRSKELQQAGFTPSGRTPRIKPPTGGGTAAARPKALKVKPPTPTG